MASTVKKIKDVPTLETEKDDDKKANIETDNEDKMDE